MGASQAMVPHRAQVNFGRLMRCCDELACDLGVEDHRRRLGAYVGAALLDEMCLTSAPLLVGGGAVRITAGSDDVLLRMRPAHVITDADGYLYTRYIRSP